MTNVAIATMAAQTLYEQGYCPQGDMENRIKEQQLYLFADCLPCEPMRSNQIRLYFSSFAYCLAQLLRRDGLCGTPLARAQCHTIRTRLLKIGGQVKVTVRRVWVHLSSSYPYRELFQLCFGLAHQLLAAEALSDQPAEFEFRQSEQTVRAERPPALLRAISSPPFRSLLFRFPSHSTLRSPPLAVRRP